MENPSTFLSSKALKLIIQAAADEIRSFLGFINNPGKSSPYSSVKEKKKYLSQLSDEMRDCAREYARKPEKFSNKALLAMGKGVESAVKNFIRIEVRQTEGVATAAQVVAKGIEGDFRLCALFSLRKKVGLGDKELTIKFAGRSSIEFNARGVNKALPFKYLSRHFNDVLEVMGYTPGSRINAFDSRTILAADGDGTIYGGPTLSTLPTLKESPARKPLNEFLKLGGVFMLISGNDMQRTAMRFRDGIDRALWHRCLLVGNGAASMAAFDVQGRLKEIKDYRRQALQYARSSNKGKALDVIFIGDDGHARGNDMDAFREVGLKRSFLVQQQLDEIHNDLKDRLLVGGIDQVGRLLEIMVKVIRTKKSSPVFTKPVINEILEKARV